ncbi:MAG TPA: tetratricopeptide repeat protein, partial [Candidatus Methylomirabilis sp.]
KDYEKAIDLYQKLERLKPDSPLPSYHLGRIYLERKMLAEARRHLAEALAKDPGFEDAVFALGYSYEVEGRWEEAKEVYLKTLQEDPQDWEVRHRFAQVLIRLKDLDQALVHGQLALEANPDFLEAKKTIGIIYMEKKSFQQAVTCFQEILAQDPDDQSSLLNLGLSLEELGRYEEALTSFSKIPPEGSFYSETLIHRGYVATLLGRFDQAIALYREALKGSPDAANFHFFLGLTYLRKKDYVQSIDCLEKAVSLDQGKEIYHFQLGAAYERMGQLDKAEGEFKEAIRLNPRQADAYNYLGYMYADRGLKLDESVFYIKKALELEPSNGAFVDSLGWAYFKKGMVDEAIRELERSLELSMMNDPTIHEHLGDAYFQKGLILKAIAEWEKSIQLNGESREQLERKIEEGKRGLTRERNDQ